MDTSQDWIATRVAYINALRNPTDAQRVLVLLFNVTNRSSKQERELSALVRLEKINEKADTARQTAYRILHQKRIVDKKLRDHRLIQVGALMEIATNDHEDRGLLLGALLYISDQLHSDRGTELGAQFKLHGDSVLKQREAARKKSISPNRLNSEYVDDVIAEPPH
jgi:hypothetical protein